MSYRNSCYAVRRHNGGIRLSALLMLMLVGGAGVLAYRHFFQRPGEAAINLIPADALMVATLDTSPSPGQALTFHRITDALNQEGIGPEFDRQVTSALSNSPIASQLRPCLANSFAAAALKGPEGGMNSANWVVLAALKESGATREVLIRNGATQDSHNNLLLFKMPNSSTVMTVLGDYLVVADKVEDLVRIARVRRGETASVVGAPGFQEARAALPSDSNLMIFVAPQALQQMADSARQNSGGVLNASLQLRDWVAVGMALHEQGIDTTVQWPVTSSQSGAIPSVAALDQALLRKLPDNAYGLMAVAQPSKYFSGVQNSAGHDLVAGRSINQGISEFERETGLSVPRDVLPGLDGDLALAVYPSVDGNRDSVDGVILLDDANGADPATLVDKVRAYAERASAQHGGTPIHFVSEQRNGATIWSLDEATQARLRDTLGGTPPPTSDGIAPPIAASASASPPAAPPSPTSTTASSPTSTTASSPTSTTASSPTPSVLSMSAPSDSPVPSDSRAGNGSDTSGNGTGNGVSADSVNNGSQGGNDDNTGYHDRDTVPAHPQIGTSGAGSVDLDLATGHLTLPMAPSPEMQRAVAGKTVIYAQIGRTVVIATSRGMLDRALAAISSGTGTLNDDPTYTRMRSQGLPGAQSLFMVDLPGIMERLRPLIEHAMESNHSGITTDDIVGLFGHNAGIVCTSRYDGSVFRASFTLPLDYVRLIHLLGVSTGSSHRVSGSQQIN